MNYVVHRCVFQKHDISTFRNNMVIMTYTIINVVVCGISYSYCNNVVTHVYDIVYTWVCIIPIRENVKTDFVLELWLGGLCTCIQVIEIPSLIPDISQFFLILFCLC